MHTTPAPMGRTRLDLPPPPNPKSWQKLWKRNCTKSVGLSFRLKNYVKLQKLAAVSLFDPDPQISLQLFAQASPCLAPCTSSFVKFLVFVKVGATEWAGVEISHKLSSDR